MRDKWEISVIHKGTTLVIGKSLSFPEVSELSADMPVKSFSGTARVIFTTEQGDSTSVIPRRLKSELEVL